MGGDFVAALAVGMLASCIGAATPASAGVGIPLDAPRRLGVTYYVAHSGSDSGSGLSPADAWRSLDKVQRATLQPGDAVLFHGGETWGGDVLKNGSSGTANAPITFGSYASGKAAFSGGLYLTNVHWQRYERLDLTNQTGSLSGSCVLLSASYGAVSDIVFDGLSVHDCGGVGVSDAFADDTRISFLNGSVRNTQDSGFYIKSSNATVANSTITNTGIDANGRISWPAHGIYAKGAAPTITANAITNFQTSGISLRFNNSDVEDNTISAARRGKYGVSYYEETAKFGTTVIANNTISGVSVVGINIDHGSTTDAYRPGGGADTTVASYSESFLIESNEVRMGAPGTAVQAQAALMVRKVPSVEITGNRLDGQIPFSLNAAAGTYYYAFYLYTNAGAYSEHGNRIHTARLGSSIFWNGAPVPWSSGAHSYLRLSREGGGDRLF